jgi:transcriptional regulator with PAS, ATPase and Fis domain
MKDILNWAEEFPAPITVSDENAKIIYMNRRSVELFKDDGGESLIGTNLMDCHNAESQAIIRKLLKEGVANTYTIEKKGKKKLIHQSPWYQNGEIKGLVEISILLPDDMQHFIRG